MGSATERAGAVCDICAEQIVEGERVVDDGSEMAHAACVADWFRRNFGREGLV